MAIRAQIFIFHRFGNFIYAGSIFNLQVDQPAGTGFSSGIYVHNENGVQKDFYGFLQEFYKQLPQYKNNSLYITGKEYLEWLLTISSIFFYESVFTSQVTHFPEFSTNQIAFEKKNKIRHKQTSLVKFIYSEKATNFFEISTIDLTVTT